MMSFLRKLSIMEMILLVILAAALVVILVLAFNESQQPSAPVVGVTPTSPIPHIETEHDYVPLDLER